MKIRTGFISNSSSSSFIIKDKTKQEQAKKILESCYGDYYIFKDVMYTSFVSDCSESYSELSKLKDDDVDGDYDTPYDSDEFLEVEGIRGICSVWLDKQTLTDEDLLSLGAVPIGIAEKLYRYVKSGINSSDKKLFYETCIKIVEGEIEDED